MDRKTILLVEDNPDDVDLAVAAFERLKLPHHLEVARDGAEALTYLVGDESASPRSLPALVLLDLKLPRVSGLEVLERLRRERRTRYLPVVILTSSNLPADVAAAYDRGCNSYVRKPVGFTKFTELIGTLTTHWLGLNEVPTA